MKKILLAIILIQWTLQCSPKSDAGTAGRVDKNADIKSARPIVQITSTSGTILKNAYSERAVDSQGNIRNASELAQQDLCQVPVNTKIVLTNSEPVRIKDGHYVLYVNSISVVKNVAVTPDARQVQTAFPVQTNQTQSTSANLTDSSEIMTRNLNCVEAKNSARLAGLDYNSTYVDCVAFSRGAVELPAALIPYYPGNSSANSDQVSDSTNTQTDSTQSETQQTISTVEKEVPLCTQFNMPWKAFVDKNAVKLFNVKVEESNNEITSKIGSIPLDMRIQHTPTSCGQASVALAISLLTGKVVSDYNISLNLLGELNAGTRETWADRDFSTGYWGAIERSTAAGYPVIIGLNTPFSPTGRGHIMLIIGVNGKEVIYHDPNGGEIKTTSKSQIENAAPRFDGGRWAKWIFIRNKFL